MIHDRLPDCFDQMIEATALACSYVEGMSKADFLADKRTQQAVILNLVIIGKVVTKLLKDHAEFLEQYPTVP